MRQIFEGVFEEQKGKRSILLTKNLAPGKIVYGEQLTRIGGVEYREWNPTRSKLGAGILKGIKELGFKKGSTVLYLGAASGTTVSHVSDILEDGFVFALDFAPRSTRDLVFLCEDRKNIIPILADAHKPESYMDKLCQVDFVFQDIAQRDQTDIFVKNCKAYLKPGGLCMFSVKSRSIDVSKKPSLVFAQVRIELEKHLKIIDQKNLEPFQRDHALFLCKK